MSSPITPSKFKERTMTADVAKWFTDIGTSEKVCVLGVYGCVTVAEAGKIIVLSDEDGTDPFLTISLETAGAMFSHTFPNNGIPLLKGVDIKANTNGTTGSATFTIVIGTWV